MSDYSVQRRPEKGAALFLGTRKRALTLAITGGGNVAMIGNNVGMGAFTVSADGKLDVMAYNDLSITAGMENSSYSYKSSSGGGCISDKLKGRRRNMIECAMAKGMCFWIA